MLSVDNTKLSFFMDHTSELLILSNKGLPREREKENIIDCSVNLLYFYSQPGRARRENNGYILCDDGMNPTEAANTCPMNFIPKCKVRYLSCAWIVDCPGLRGMVFKKRLSADRYLANGLQKLNYKTSDGEEVSCLPTHLQYSLICCGYYCKT